MLEFLEFLIIFVASNSLNIYIKKSYHFYICNITHQISDNKAEVKLKLETRGKLLTIMSLLKVFQKLKSSAQKRPLLFNSMIYGSFYTGAEFAQQTYNKIFKVISLFVRSRYTIERIKISGKIF